MPRRWKGAITVLTILAIYGAVLTIGAHHSRPVRAPRVRAVSSLPDSPASPGTAAGFAGGRAGATTQGGRTPATWSLPGSSRYLGVAAVGFPHTTMGAVALGYSALAARYTTDPDIAVSVVRATALAPTTTLLEAVAEGTEELRTRFGLTPTGPTPTTIGLSLVACMVTSATPTRVVAAYEGTLSVEGGSVEGTSAEVSTAIVVAWDGSDWKIDPTADLPSPSIDFPAGPGTQTSGGWHACSEV